MVMVKRGGVHGLGRKRRGQWSVEKGAGPMVCGERGGANGLGRKGRGQWSVEKG